MDLRGTLDSGRAAINQLGPMMDSFDLDKANSEGYVAGEHGASRSANPYPRGHFLHEAWLDGWDEAWEDFEADRREPQLTGLEKFVILVLIAFGTALVCRGIFWLLVFLS